MKKHLFKTLRSRLTFWFLIMALIPLLIGILVTYNQSKQIIEKDAFAKLTAIRDLKVQQLGYWLDERLGDLHVISNNFEIRGLDEAFEKKIITPEQVRKVEIARKLLDRYLKYYASYTELFIINSQTGIVEISTNPDYIGMDKSNDDYFTKPLQSGEAFIKDIYKSKTIGYNTMTFSIPIFSLPPDMQNIFGILVMRIDLFDSLYPMLSNRVGLGNTGETLIVNKDVVALNKLRRYEKAPLKLQITAKPAVNASQGMTGITITTDYVGEDILAAYTYIPRTQWGFVSKQDIDELNVPVNTLIKNLVVIFIISAIVVILIVLWIAKRISKPIVNLNTAAQKIKKGDYSAKVTASYCDELGSLANSFNKMTDSIESNITIQEEQNIKLQVQQKQLKEKNRELDITNTKLEASNSELEAFAYSVSHDLRTPLRAIDGFSRILVEDYASKLDKEGQRIGSVVQDNAIKMGKLIDDLLAFSSLGRTSMTYSKINMKEMVKANYHEATYEEERKKIKLTVDELTDVEGDVNMMRQVWMNLISNAVKFSSHRKQAVISISCHNEENQITYIIKDNGAGFNMKYKQNLFAVFKRLHSEKEFKGTGVGLALVQRIIIRHGGKIWADSEIDKGATFCFSLPISSNQQGA